MPEGHTIHRAARDQRKLLVGAALTVTSPQGRFAAGAARLDGRSCIGIEAHGKHLLYAFADGDALHVHLGLFGRFRAAAQPAPAPRDTVRVRLASASHVVDVIGPNTCAVLTPDEVAALVARIGPDVLRADADPDRAGARIARSAAPIGLLLMDQGVVAGIGNIYRTEILWRLGIHPEIAGRDLRPGDWQRIWAEACRLLALGVRLGAIVTVDDATPSRRRYGERVNIFAQESCPRCAGAIRLLAMGGRKAYVCETCQPPGGPGNARPVTSRA
jgi:endonuclease-8